MSKWGGDMSGRDKLCHLYSDGMQTQSEICYLKQGLRLCGSVNGDPTNSKKNLNTWELNGWDQI